ISGIASIDVTAGSHTVAAPLALADNTTVTVAAGSTLTASNLQPSAVTITKADAGTLAVNNVRSGGLVINGGTVTVLPDGTAAGASAVSSLVLAGTTDAWAGKLDITNNDVLLHSTPAAKNADRD